jgi:hypothetical protein
VHGQPQTNDAGRTATTISSGGERLGQMAGQRGKAGRGQRSSGNGSANTGAARCMV